MNALEGLLIPCIGAMFFLTTITTILHISSDGYDYIYNVKQGIVQNETVSSNGLEYPHLGIYEDDELKYDGSFMGDEVLQNIFDSIKDYPIKIVQSNGNVVDLQTMNVKGEPISRYVQKDSTPLKEMLDMNGTYARHYIINVHGEIVEIVYIHESQAGG